MVKLCFMKTDYFSHESACVDAGAEIGEGTRIWHFSHIMPGAKIGRHCNLVISAAVNQPWCPGLFPAL